MTFRRIAKIRTTDQNTSRVRYSTVKMSINEKRFKMESIYGQDLEEEIFWNIFIEFMKEWLVEQPYEQYDLIVDSPYRFNCEYGCSGCRDWSIEIAYDKDCPFLFKNILHISMYGKLNEGAHTDPSFLLMLAKHLGVNHRSGKKFTVEHEDGRGKVVEFFFKKPRDIDSEEGWILGGFNADEVLYALPIKEG